jgi:hypothetical protein
VSRSRSRSVVLEVNVVGEVIVKMLGRGLEVKVERRGLEVRFKRLVVS